MDGIEKHSTHDLKLAHIYSRPGSRSGQFHVVFIDFGLAQIPALTYDSSEPTVEGHCEGRQAQQQPVTVSYDHPIFAPGKPIRILGAPNGRPGTLGCRPPVEYPSGRGPVNVNMYQLGMILLYVICSHLFDGDHPESELFAEHKSTLQPDRFQAEVLTSIDRERARKLPSIAGATRRASQAMGIAAGAPKLNQPFGVDIVRLCQKILNGEITQAYQVYASSFVSRYIPTSIEWFNRLCAKGLAVKAYGDVRNPLVIVWDRERGFEVINLFSFDKDEFVIYYMGWLLTRITGAKPTPQMFSYHSIAVDEGHIIDGTPDQTLTVDVMATFAAAGSLVGSSRTAPATRNPAGANLTSPQKQSMKRCREVVLSCGETLHTVAMKGIRPTAFGSLSAWCYNWLSQGMGTPPALTEEEIRNAIKIRESMPQHWWDIVRERRLEFLAKGFRDSIFKTGCSITTCRCEPDSSSEASIFQFDQDNDARLCLEACGSLGVPKSSHDYWEMPTLMSDRVRQSVSVCTDFFEMGTSVVDVTKREAARQEVRKKLDAKGLVILENFYDACPEGRSRYVEAEASARTMQFPNEISLNVPKNGVADRGDRTKTMTDEIVDNHPVSQALDFVAHHYLPGMVVSQGEDVKTGKRCTERAVLKQTEVKHHARLRQAGVYSSVHQILHTDKEMYSVLGQPRDPQNLNRENLDFFMRGKGPLSIWVPLVGSGDSEFLSLVGYLGSHTYALTLWVFMARHYAKMKEAYQRGRTANEVKDDTFLRVWIGAARLFLKREHPNERIVAERIPAWRYDVLLVHGLFVHGGTDEVGLRMFAGYSQAVSVAPINLCRC